MLVAVLWLAAGAATTVALQKDVSAMALQYFAARDVRLLTVFTCRALDAQRLARATPGWVLTPRSLGSAPPQQFTRQGVFLDHDCASGRRLLQESSENGLLNGTYHWLVWSEVEDPAARHAVLRRGLRLDSEVAWASRGSTGELRVTELYSTGQGAPVLETAAACWSATTGLRYLLERYKYLRRGDMQGQPVRAAVVLNSALKNPEVDLLKAENRFADAMAVYNYHIFLILQKMFNFTLDMVVTSKFGVVVEGGTYDGVVQMLHEGRVDTAISTFVFVHDRMKYIDYSSGYSWRFRMCAIFRHPPVSGGTDALVRPFSGALWFGMFSLWLLIVSFLRLMAWLQPQYADITGENHEDIPTSSDLFLLVVGIVGEQGTWLDSRWLTWRFVLLMMLMLTVLLNTYYAANVVSTLLNQSPFTIRTLKNLIDSSLQFAAEDVIYSRSYFEITNNSLIRKLYTKKMAPWGGNYISMEKGLERVQNGDFAYHMEDVRAYWAIEQLFPDSKKCALREIELFPGEMGYYVYPFNSPYKKIFTYGLRRVVEVGLWDHENRRIRPRKPSCSSQGAEVVSVDLASLTPAFGLVLAGCAVGLLALVVELLHARATRRAMPSAPRKTQLAGSFVHN